jgi:hypothetical protein
MKEDSSAWVELDGGNGHLYILTDIDMKRYQEGKKFTYLISIGAPMEQSIDGYGAYIDFKEGKHWVVLENQESNASVTGHVKIYEPGLKSECGDPEPTSPNLDELPFFAAPGFPAGLGLVAIAIVAVGVARLR